MKNPYPFSTTTTERQRGGNTAPTEGEAHGQKKATRITEDRRFDGADTTNLENSPGRASSDVQDRR